MENLDNILNQYVADGGDTANRLLGAAFIVCNKDGTARPILKPYNILTKGRHPV